MNLIITVLEEFGNYDERSFRRSFFKHGQIFLLFAVLFLSGSYAWGQRTEIGFGLGALSYMGDLVPYYDVLSNRPGGEVFVRTNVNRAVSFRYGLAGGLLQAKDVPAPDVFAAQRDASFSTGLLEATAIFEYNFLNFRDKNALLHWTPYFYGGLGGVLVFGGSSSAIGPTVQPAIPFGVGMKYMLNQRFVLAFKAGTRKLFFDTIDGVSGGDTSTKNYQHGNPKNNDWYFYTGISLSYTFFGVHCPY